MKVLIVTASPNTSGLTAACGEAARQGVVDGRSPARVIDLNTLNIARCAVCNDGWGTCRTDHVCQIKDDFQELHESVRLAEGFVFVTPVYFGEPSESMKAFLNRLRRCEALHSGSRDDRSALFGKPVVCVAAAGGTGHGTAHCLSLMERALERIGAEMADLIGVTKRTRDYQLETIHDALVAMTTTPKEKAPRYGREQQRRRRPTRSRRRRPSK